MKLSVLGVIFRHFNALNPISRLRLFVLLISRPCNEGGHDLNGEILAMFKLILLVNIGCGASFLGELNPISGSDYSYS